MRPDQIIQRARDVAGFENFHCDSFREGLEILSADLDHSPLLDERGRAAIEQTFVNLLAQRLRVDDWHARHPELSQTPVERPVFIVGMPRTGTTAVSYLLDADPARRSLLKWEVWGGVPPAPSGQLRTDPRCLAMVEAERKAATSEIAVMHHEDANGPSECTFVVAQDFRSAFLEALHPAPAYRDWYLRTRMTSAYQVHKRMLQVLQSTNGGTWNLKMPSHALFIEDLLETYPDARIIWTHRDPYKTMGSLISLIHGTHRRFCPDSDTMAYCADHYPRQISGHALRMMAAEDKGVLHAGNCFHLFYHEMLADPIGEMKRIYAWLGDDLTPEVEANMLAWLRSKPQGHFGKHRYSLAQQGLSVEQLHPYFADYLSRYPIQMEGAA